MKIIFKKFNVYFYNIKQYIFTTFHKRLLFLKYTHYTWFGTIVTLTTEHCFIVKSSKSNNIILNHLLCYLKTTVRK